MDKEGDSHDVRYDTLKLFTSYWGNQLVHGTLVSTAFPRWRTLSDTTRVYIEPTWDGAEGPRTKTKICVRPGCWV